MRVKHVILLTVFTFPLPMGEGVPLEIKAFINTTPPKIAIERGPLIKTVALPHSTQKGKGQQQSELERYFSILKRNPSDFTANLNVGLILLHQRKPEEAIPYLNKASALQPQRPEPYIARANAYIDLNDLEKALTVLQNGANACSKLPEYWIMRASLEVSLFKRESAKNSLSRARALEPSSADLRFRIGILSLQVGEAQQAEEQLRLAAFQDPSNSTYVHEWVDALIKIQPREKAKRLLFDLVDKNPINPEALATACNGLHRIGSTQDALTLLQKALTISHDPAPLYTEIAFILHTTGSKEEAQTALTQALLKNPDYPPALALRAFIKLEEGDLIGASEDSQHALRKNPLLADAHRTRWTAHYRLGQIKKAESALRAWIAALPTDPAPYQPLADLLYRQKRYAEAGALLEIALKLLPDDPTLLAFLAQAYTSAGLGERAAQILQSAVSRGVRHQEVLMRLALAHRQTGKHALAIATLRDMQTLYPDDERAWLLEATTHEQARNFRDAVEVYREYLLRAPNNPSALEGLARSLGNAGKHEESAHAWLFFADKYPEVILAYYNAAREFNMAGKTEEAENVWKILFQKRPDDPNGIAGYAQFLIETGRTQEALRSYERLQQTHPDKPFAYLAASAVYQREGNINDSAAVLIKGVKAVFQAPSLEGTSDEPDHFKLLDEASQVLERLGRLEELDQVLEDIIQANRLSPAPLLAYVKSAHRRGVLPEASQTLQEALRKNPKNGYLLIALARMEALKGNGQEALNHLERAVDLLPHDLSAVKTFAEAAETARDATRSAKGYELLSRLVPNEPGYRLKHAAYLIELGETTKARAVLIEAVQTFPDNRELQEMLTRIFSTQK